MAGDAGEDVGEPGLRVDIVEAGGLDQGVEDGGALTAAVRTAKQPCLPPERYRPFILPMSGKRGKFTICGIPTSDEWSPSGV